MKLGITCHPTAGGSGIVATSLGIALADRGHEVHFVTYDTPYRITEFHQNIVSHTVETISYPLFQNSPASLALATKISDIAEEYGIQLWHAHYAIPHAACAILANDMLPEAKRFKIVTTLHGTDITLVGSDPSFFRITKYAMERSDAVTAVSNWLKEETEREFSLNQPVKMIYNFLDESKYPLDVHHRCNLAEEGEKIIMHISNFRPVKRVTDIVRVFKRVLDAVDARLVMVGDGPERMSALGVAKQLGVTDKIKWLGNYQDIETILPCADIVFQPSEHESFGMVALEAMASGVPVLATRSGGIVEVVEDGINGYLCDVGDIDTMSARAIELLTDAEKSKAFGASGRERATTVFAQDPIIDQYEALYRELLKS